LVDFDDVSYDDSADLLYGLAKQTVDHLKDYLKDENDVRKVLRVHQKPIAELIHAQMAKHHWEEKTEYEVQVTKGFTPLKPSSFTTPVAGGILDYRTPPKDKGRIAQCVFNGFSRCLCQPVKFQSDTERVLAIILDRDSQRWFRPALGQFQIYYHADHEYQPDFVAEVADAVYMIEAKRVTDLNTPEVKAKRVAGVRWCMHATDYLRRHGGKPWRYLLIPHNAVSENMTLAGLANHN
jgi:type III restriction enzyme